MHMPSEDAAMHAHAHVHTCTRAHMHMLMHMLMYMHTHVHTCAYAAHTCTSQCVKSLVEDLAKMHKSLQPLLTRQQLHTVFERVLGSFDVGMLAAYKAVDSSALFTRQCMVADILFLRQVTN